MREEKGETTVPDNTKPRRGFALCVSSRFPLAILVAALVARPFVFPSLLGTRWANMEANHRCVVSSSLGEKRVRGPT